jgi:alpha-1,2-mannosyltransferase
MAPSLSRGDWFDAERARRWSFALVAVSGLIVLMLLVGTRGGTAADPWGRPLGPDFSSFWVAGRLALADAAAAAWDPVAHGVAQHDYFPTDAGYNGDYYGFYYPPPFLLVLLPFAMLPYGLAISAWIVATSAGYLACLRQLVQRHWSVTLPGLAFPALLINAEHGQNGALSAALLAGGASLLDRQPRLAGACLGLLSIKPQLALLAAPALLAAGRFRALAWAGASAGVLCLTSWVLLGGDSWRAFLTHGPFALVALEEGLVGDAKMVSSFAGARLLGASVGTAWVVQAIVSAIALVAVAGVARRRPGAFAEIATVGVAACLVTPFLLDYDLMIVSVPLTWAVCDASSTGFRRWEKLILITAFALPLVVRPIAMHIGIPIAPIVIMGLLWVVTSRAYNPDCVRSRMVRAQAWARGTSEAMSSHSSGV